MTPRVSIFFLLHFISLTFFAGNLDSLMKIKDSQSGAEKIQTLNKISIEYRKSDLKKAREYAQLALNESQQTNDLKAIGDSYNNMATVLNFEGDYDGAINHFERSFLFRQKLNDSSGMASSLSNIGVMYRKLNNFEKAFEYYQQSLIIKEKLNKPAEVIITLNNIGSLFYYERNFKKAHEYYEKALSLAIEIKDSSTMAAAYNNLGLVLSDEGDYQKSLEYYTFALRIRENLHDEPGIAVVMNNLGVLYEAQGKNDQALGYLKKAAKMYQEENDLPDYANTLFNIGNIYLAKKNYPEAIKYYKESEVLSERFYNRVLLRDLYNSLGRAYHYTGNDNESYNHLMKYIHLNDSIYDESTLEKISEKEIKYQAEKKQKENEILKQQNELKDLRHDQSVAQQRMVRIYFIFGLGLALSIALLFYIRFRTKRKSERQLSLYNTEILRQKHLVDEKNKEIMDSINYAQKIQSAILPSIERFESILPGSFVFFKPKDIVSGDFYWISEKENAVFFAAVDCTGHGVPGGFMSMLGSSLLHEIINEKNISEPADILDLMRVKIIQALKQTGASGENKDGMDMALCRYDFKQKKIVYAGANNDLIFLRNGIITSFKATKQPIGITFGNPTNFAQTEIPLETGDSIFIYSDGYADQFGGPKGKKFKYKQLKELLASFSDKSPEEKKRLLDETFISWTGNLEQIDDVLVIGLTV